MKTLQSIAASVEAYTGNVAPLLHEIRHALKRVADGGEGTVIDLGGLPLAPGEEEKIRSLLGEGEVRAELQALGPTTVQETAYTGVWFITHRNAAGETVARFIEVTRIPELLLAQIEDMRRALPRLEQLLQKSENLDEHRTQ